MELPEEEQGERRLLPQGGFLGPTLFDENIGKFFAIANIGPIITGEFILDNQGRRARPNTATLRPTDTPLNQSLYFTMPEIDGQPNPLYCITSPGSLTPLFSLHAYYTKMQNPGDPTRLSASDTMRLYFREIIIEIIKRDAQAVIARGINSVQLIDQVLNVVPILIQSIDDPSVAIYDKIEFEFVDQNGQIDRDEIFNPCYFLYAHFAKIISASKLKSLTNEDLRILQEPTRLVYENVIPFGFNTSFGDVFVLVENGDYVSVILDSQFPRITLARAYKNKMQTEEQRRRRVEQRGLGQQPQFFQRVFPQGLPERLELPPGELPGLPVPQEGFQLPQGGFQLPQPIFFNQPLPQGQFQLPLPQGGLPGLPGLPQQGFQLPQGNNNL